MVAQTSTAPTWPSLRAAWNRTMLARGPSTPHFNQLRDASDPLPAIRIAQDISH